MGDDAAPVLRDPRLDALARLAAIGGAFPVMMVVDGILVSGQTISEHRFLERVAETVRPAKGIEPARDLAKWFAGDLRDDAAEIETSLAARLEADDPPDFPNVDFLHLESVVFHLGAPPGAHLSAAGVWRCKLSAVSAYMMGRIDIPKLDWPPI